MLRALRIAPRIVVAACLHAGCVPQDGPPNDRQAAAMAAIQALPLDSLCRDFGPECSRVSVDRRVRTSRDWWPQLQDTSVAYTLPTQLSPGGDGGRPAIRVTELPFDYGSASAEVRIWLLEVDKASGEADGRREFSAVIFRPGTFVPVVAIVSVRRQAHGWQVIALSFAEG